MKNDPGFNLNLAHDSNNKVLMTSYIRDNFERFGNYISIYVMHSSIYNAKEFCYISPVIKDEIGKINVFCEGFVFRKLIMLIHLFWIHCSRCALFEKKTGVCYIF